MDKKVATIEDYAPLIGNEAVERIQRKAMSLKDFRVLHINSTFYGGGVAELLSSLMVLLGTLGLKADWRTIHGSPDFFSVTKKIHNALQGGDINLTDRKLQIYRDTIHKNTFMMHPDNEDMIVVHDPQPLLLIEFYKKHCPWIWRCHIDLSKPHSLLWQAMSRAVERYDAAIFHIPEYARELRVPQLFFMPAINPFSTTNKPLSEDEIGERLAHYQIPTDLPIVAQVSRFDRWKDPIGVIEAFKMARKRINATLVLLGNIAADDPEGPDVYQSLLSHQEERILILSRQDAALVNALQRKAAVIFQKSIREGFGLTVTEAMWKGTPVIGGNVGGIRHQIQDGENGFLVNSVAEAAERLVRLLEDPELRKRIGSAAKETVRSKFLLSRYAEQHLDLYGAFEAEFHLRRLI
ncbi:MAG: glycosyltransferase [Nitrospirota bacterium]|nr:glycosyltransferase [Nitrospirota bacterium]